MEDKDDSQQDEAILPAVQSDNGQAQITSSSSQLLPTPARQVQSISNDNTTSTMPVLPTQNGLNAEDVELIERAWVEKAKAIVNSTHGDPYNQNKELSKVKADYIKKRFDKDIKVSE